MKKFILASLLCGMLGVMGCWSTIPQPSTVQTCAKAIGVASAYACKLTNVDKMVMKSITNVMDAMYLVTPSTNSTCAETWSPIIKSEVAKLISTAKIDTIQGETISNLLVYSANCVDYIFTKHPLWKQHTDLVLASITGFRTGFEFAITVAFNTTKTLSAPNVEIDMEAFKYFSAMQTTQDK